MVQQWKQLTYWTEESKAMYKKVIVLTVLSAVVCMLGFSPEGLATVQSVGPNGRERKIQREVVDQLLTFRRYLKDSLSTEVNRNAVNELKLKNSFLSARLLFKKFEWAAEYFTADLTKRLNGPPVQEVENADLLAPSLSRGIDPMGLQVLEQLIYPHYDPSDQAALTAQLNHLITNTDYLISYFTDHQLDDWRILDAAKLEVFRIICLGITGFDNGLSLHSMEESAEALTSLRQVLHRYDTTKGNSALAKDLDAAIGYLQDHANFNTFDRAAFITGFANKISTGIATLERNLPGTKIKYNRMLRQNVNTLFDTGAFNVDAFSPGPDFRLSDAKVRLGRKLFYDVNLSGTHTRSCASCHQPDLAFTDAVARQEELHHAGRPLKRNTPTLLNAALQSNYFYDMRSLTLEDQVVDVISNKKEMDGSMADIVKYVTSDSSYQLLLAKAFPKSSSVTGDKQIANALACYIRSLTKLNSRFDTYMRGDMEALSGQELNGFNLFMGKAKCGTCHFLPLFNGITPPKFVQSEVEVLGVPLSRRDSIVDSDLGYFNVIGVDSYKHAFKTPSVRNIGKTAPYMHNGVFRTLDEVMEFYNNGGAAGLGIRLPNQTLPEENLHLSEKEKKNIIAFMESLESR